MEALTYQRNGKEYIAIENVEIEVDSAGMVSPEKHTREIVAAFDAIKSIRLQNGDIIA